MTPAQILFVAQNSASHTDKGKQRITSLAKEYHNVSCNRGLNEFKGKSSSPKKLFWKRELYQCGVLLNQYPPQACVVGRMAKSCIF